MRRTLLHLPIPRQIRDRRILTEIGIPAGLFFLALSLRLPYVKDVSRWTDEILDMLVALSFSRFEPIVHGIGAAQDGAHIPLVGYQPYTGALYHYIVAAAWWVFGHDPFLPRLVMAVASASTVVVAYLWGKEIGGRTAGLLAGGMLAVSAPAINYGSHYAHSNTLTPLFATLTLWTAHASILRRSPRYLAMSGFCFGLALQTHPTALVLVPAIGLYLALRRPPWLSKRHVFMALLLAVVAYGNVIVYNIGTAGGTVRTGIGQREYYSGPQQFGLTRYLAEVRDAADLLLALSFQNVVGPGYVLQNSEATSILVNAYPVLVAAGLLYTAWRREYLFAFVFLFAIVLVPLIVGAGLFHGRYWVLLLPVACVAVGRMLSAELENRDVRWTAAVSVGTFSLIVSYPAIGIMQHLHNAAQIEPTNQELAQLATQAAAARRPSETILIDHDLFASRPPDETNVTRSISYFLRFAKAPEDGNGVITSSMLKAHMEQRPSQLAVLEPTKRASLEREFELSDIAELRTFDRTVPLLEVVRVERLHSLPRVAHATDGIFENGIKLLGYDLGSSQAKPGDRLELTLYWQTTRSISENYTVFTHLLDANAKLAGQLDGQPMDGIRPTRSWQPDEIIIDQRGIPVAPTASPGPARVEVGLYLLATMQRLPLDRADGGTGENVVVLPASLTILPP